MVDFGVVWLGCDVIVVVLLYDSCMVELVGCVVIVVFGGCYCLLFV